MRKTIELHKRWKDNPSKGEVFTPEELVREMLDKIPVSVWEDPKSIFLDPCMGKGTFLIEILRRLVNIYGYSKEDAMSRIYGYDVRVKYINYLKRGGFVNVFHKDFLSEKIDMKFDVVVGNPPYQEKVGDRKTEPLWNKFVLKSFNILKEDSYLSLIHPSGWRNITGKFKDIQEVIRSKKVSYLSIHNEKDGMETFGAETRYDYYVLQNVDSDGSETTVRFQDGQIKNMVLDNMDFIPNGGIDLLNTLIAKDGEETVELLYSRSGYGTDKVHTSKLHTDDFMYPVVYTVNYLSEPTFHYSSTNQNGHFGKPKVIWSNGRISSIGNYIDKTGEFGLTQFAYAIVDEVENLQNIKKALDSKKFKNLMELCAVGQLTVNHKVVAKFKKDFWKEFINE